jgi:hypothetical protein
MVGSSSISKAKRRSPMLPENHPAKEARKRDWSLRKSPRLFLTEADWGLQCGLSGNPASPMVTR